MLWTMYRLQVAASVLGERTNVKQYIILTSVAAGLILVSILLKLLTKKKK